MQSEQISVITEKLLVQHGDQFVPMVVRIWAPSIKPRGSVFCFHDFAGNGRDFDPMAAFLCANGYQVICPDLIGRGKSGYIGAPESYSPELYIQCLNALNKFGSKENYFIGVCWGGTTLLLTWALSAWKISKLILVDPPLVGSAQVDQLREQILDDMNAQFKTRSDAEKHVLRSFEDDPYFGSAAAGDLAANRVIKIDEHYRLAFDPAATGYFSKLQGQKYDLYPVINRINAPVLLLHSAKTSLIDPASIGRHFDSRLDRWAFSLNHVSTTWAMRPDQAFLVLGFLSASQ